jgi:ubiquinone/menaquinone biosynthesis C-methylase UbiE
MIELEQKVKKANKNLYDIVGSSYEEIDGRRSEALVQYVAARLKAISRETDGISILDLGCGSGFVSRVARGYFQHRSAIDISSRILQGVGDSTLLKITGDLDFIPVKSESFSCVGTFAVLHHCYSFEKMFHEIYRVLKKGGRFYSDHDMDAFFYNRYRSLLKIYRMMNNAKKHYLSKFSQLTEEIYNCSEFHQKGIPSDSIRNMLNDIGFKDIKMEYHWYGLSPLIDKIFGEKPYKRGNAPLVRIIAIK